MAEQINHNVVNQPESTSGLAPLVDTATNHTTAVSAGNGNESNAANYLNLPASLDNIAPTKAYNNLAADIDATNFETGADAMAGADPSAGDATAQLANAPASTTKPTSEEAHGDAGIGSTPIVNGTHDALSSVDEAAFDVSADPSVASDTETSRADVMELLKDGSQHNRTNSVKKPATFSKVAVTKNFLAKSATANLVATKPGEKITVAGSPAPMIAKPRLVAKSASTLSNLTRIRPGADSPAGPDASKVWNKNRPAPTMPPKQFTDEELKQQYGIHLATRLQSDENGKENKWADIDDDEEDWAPETVEWMDGTKSTLTHADNAPAVADEQKSATPSPVKPAEAVRPSLVISKKTVESSGPVKTILKPGSAVQNKQNGATTASSAAEKPTLKAKSPAPVPAKSPWAPLPPVDNASSINLPVQAQAPYQAPLSSQDARSLDSAMPAPLPAREIAADTFDRSWREGERERRELFNSANGRYEPVSEGRHNATKSETYGRKPSLLQRPIQGSNYPEPSAAFQTRSSGQDGPGPWTRRRGSSVSQGSGPTARRLSMHKPSDLLPERQPNTAVGRDSRAPPILNEASEPTFSQQTPWAQQLPPPPAQAPAPALPASDDAEVEDPVKVQERVMREKREAARRRRQEEEEREEAAKKERLAAKLASLESAGQSRKERQQAAANASTNVVVETPSTEHGGELDSSSLFDAEKTADKSSRLSADSAGSEAFADLAASSETTSSGAQLKDLTPEEVGDVPGPIPKPQEGARQTSAADQSQRGPPREHLSPNATSRSALQASGASASPYRTAQPSSFSSPSDRERKSQPFGRSPMPSSDTFTPWPSAGPSGNVWGTSGIGNGTFDSSSTFAPIPMSQQSSSLPPPPGMVRPATTTRISPQGLPQDSRSPNLQQAQTAEPQRGFGSGIDSRPDHFMGQSRVNGVSPSPGMGRQQRVPGPIAPPSRAQQQNVLAEGVSAWQAAAQRIPSQYASETDAANKQLSFEGSADVKEKQNNTFKETFRQTSTSQGKLGGARKFDKTEYIVHDAQGSHTLSETLAPTPPNTQTQPAGVVPITSPLNEPWKQPGESQVRIPDGSRNPAHGGVSTEQSPIAPPASAPLPPHVTRAKFNQSPLTPALPTKDKSPPPPETTSHPVYDGLDYRPNIRLPPPPAVVKLPPSSSTSPPIPNAPVMIPQRPIQNWGPIGAHRPIVMNEAWQARFNGLFNRTPIHTETPPSPPKTPPKSHGPVLAVSSSSRALMDDMALMSDATVSLPLSMYTEDSPAFTIDDSSDVTSKEAVQKMFNDELGFGSRPMVRIPLDPNYEPLEFVDTNLLATQQNTSSTATVEAQVKPDLGTVYLFYKKPEGIFVKLPGSLRNKLVFHRRSTKPSSGKVDKTKSSTPPAKRGAVASPVSAVPNGTPTSRKYSAPKPSHSPSFFATNTATAGPASTANRKKSGFTKPTKGTPNVTPVKSN